MSKLHPRLETSSTEFHIEDFETTAEWAEHRKEGVGASAVGVLLGLSHFSSPQKLYAQITGEIDPEPENDVMKRGHRMEIVVANDFAEATGAIIMEDSAHDFLVVDNEKPWRRVSPDRYWWPAGTAPSEQTVDNAFLLECKTCQMRDELRHHVEITPDNVFDYFPYWYAQCQYQMGVCRKQKDVIAWIDCLDPNLPFGYKEVEFNQSYFDMAMNTVDDFWCNNVLLAIPPEKISSEEDANIRFKTADPDSDIVTTDRILSLIKRHFEIDFSVKQLNEEEEQIKTEIKTFMGHNERLMTADRQMLVSWKTRAGSCKVDSKKLKKLYPDIYEEVLNEGKPTRTFSYVSAV